jgi:hypothetical protein
MDLSISDWMSGEMVNSLCPFTVSLTCAGRGTEMPGSPALESLPVSATMVRVAQP